MSRFFFNTGRFWALRSRVEHISTRSCPSGWPCLPVSSRKSWREPLFPWENRVLYRVPYPQLFRRLAHSCSVLGAVKRTQGFGAQSPQLVGPSGQLGKEQTSPSAEDLFSQYGVGFGQTVSMPHRGTCSVGVELPEYIQWQDSGPTETISEAPGAYGSRSNPASFSSYETASALASWPSPEMGVTRITPVCRQAFSPWLDP